MEVRVLKDGIPFETFLCEGPIQDFRRGEEWKLPKSLNLQKSHEFLLEKENVFQLSFFYPCFLLAKTFHDFRSKALNIEVKISIAASLTDDVSDFLWGQHFEDFTILGMEELPPGGDTLFRTQEGHEVLEFGTRAAEECADWLEQQAYRGKGAIHLKIYLEVSDSKVSIDESISKTSSELLKSLLDRGWAADLISASLIEAQDYLANYKATVKGRQLGRTLWIGPPWEVPPSDLMPLIVEPGLAFGTGEHPTTSMCLLGLEALAQGGFYPQRILDLGAGTGVLGILALKLWPNAKIDFVDNDPLCKQEIEKNFDLNHMLLTPQIRIGLRMFEESPIYDLVISNIYGEVLAQLAPQVANVLKAPHGLWMASGILQGNAEEMVSQKAQVLGFQETDRRTQDHEQETWVYRLWGLPQNHVKSSS